MGSQTLLQPAGAPLRCASYSVVQAPWLRYRGRLITWLSCLTLGLQAGHSAAQEVIPDFHKDPGLNPNRSFINQSFSEHIDPFTGALQLHYVDVRIPGNGGFDLNVVRSYNSTSFDETNPAAFDSQAGLGWTIHFGRVLNKTSTLPCQGNVFGLDTLNNPVIELPDGSTQLLVYSGTVSPLMYTTKRWKADCAAGGNGLIVHSPDGTRYDMTQQVTVGTGTNTRQGWYTTRITDRNNNVATISYTAAFSPRISSVSATDGRVINFSYNSNALVSAVSTTAYTYTYNYQAIAGGKFQLISVVRPGGTSWQYEYNGVISPPGSYALKKVTYPEGGVISYGYGSTVNDYVYFDTHQASRSTAVKSKTTNDGGSWTFSYSPGRGSYDSTTVTGPAGTTTYVHMGPNYATSGSLWMVGLLLEKRVGTLQTERYAWSSQAISNQQYKRPGAWRASRLDQTTNAPMLTSREIIRDGQSYVTTFSGFDGFGNPTRIDETGPNGGSRTTTLTYFNGTPKWIINQVQNQTVSGGTSISRVFDANGNLKTFTRDGVSTSHDYVANGNVSRTSFPRGLVHTYPSYKLGIALEENQPEGLTIRRTVSDVGNVTSETNGEQRTSTYSYDGLNRITGVGYPVGNAVGITHNATSKVATRGTLQESTQYDGFGRARTVTLGGISRTYGYDPLGRSTFISNPGVAGGTTYGYDILNRVGQVTNVDGTSRVISYGAGFRTVRNERNVSTTYVYKGYGDPDQVFLLQVRPPDASANIDITRDARDLVRSVAQGGLVRTFVPDARGYLASVTNPETGQTLYGRDDAGNMTSRAVGASGSTAYGYDGLNRLISVVYPGGTPGVTKTYTKTHRLASVVTSAASRTYAYDANDNLRAETLGIDGLSLSLSYDYNGNDQLSSITYPLSGRVVSYAPDALGRPTQVSGFVSSLSFWPSGQVNQISYANGTASSYGQDSRLRPSTFVTAKGGSSYLSSAYGYDGASNLTSVTDAVDGSYNRTVGYDNLERVNSVSGPWGSGTLTYDGVGNLRSQVFGGFSISYSYGSTNLLSAVSGARNASFGYDAYGDIVSAGTSTHVYDGAPNLTCANCGDSATRVQYQYDGLSQRVSSLRNGIKTYELHGSNGSLLVEYTPSGANRLVEHIYLGGKRIAQIDPAPTSVTPGGGGAPITATAGRAFTLTVTVSGSSPTGTVSFYDGTTLLGSANVVNGAASLAATISRPGTHTITANYSGDIANAPSTTTLTVNVLIPPEQLVPILNLLLED